MSDGSRRERLIEELFPAPPPPRDMAARVLAALADDAGRGTGATNTTIGKAAARRSRTPLWSSAAAAGVLALLGWWASARWSPFADAGDQGGQLIATAAQTVNIGVRAAAAAEPGADLAWSVKGRRARVDQRRGSVFYRVNHGGPFHVVTPAGDVEVTGTCFRVALGAGASGPAATTLVSVLEGSVKVHTDVGQLAITVGQTARLSRGHAPEIVPSASTDQLQGRLDRALARLQQLEGRLADSEREAARAPLRRPAALLLPLSSRLRVFGDRGGGLREVSLALADAGDDSRQPQAVQVARDPAFQQPVWSGVVREGFVTVPAPERGDLYWRQLGDDAEAGPAGHARFSLDRPARRAPDSPHNVVGDGRDNTTIYFQSAPPAISLTWEPVANARQYRVRIYRAQALDQPIVEQVVTSTRCDVAAGALGEGAHVWNALPLDQQGHALGGGRMNRLELAYDNAVDSLTLTQLHTGPAGDPDTIAVDVAGVAPLGARLFVNGKTAALDAKGRFALRVTGAPRQLVFRMVGSDGSESYWVKPVKPRS
jgi:hypothetical protein